MGACTVEILGLRHPMRNGESRFFLNDTVFVQTSEKRTAVNIMGEHPQTHWVTENDPKKGIIAPSNAPVIIQHTPPETGSTFSEK